MSEGDNFGGYKICGPLTSGTSSGISSSSVSMEGDVEDGEEHSISHVKAGYPHCFNSQSLHFGGTVCVVSLIVIL